MPGYILLAGGAEFGGQMAVPDQQAMTLAGGPEVPIVIIPTAAAPDNNHQRAGNNGRRWFGGLGATQVMVAPLVDQASANDPAIAQILSEAKLIYLLGGFTHYLGQTLRGSRSWEAILSAYSQQGAVVVGSSAGAMVLCEYYYDPGNGRVQPGLNLVPNACVLPHHNTFGRRWAKQLGQLLPTVTLIGVDEYTGMINHGPQQTWQVYGQGHITLYNEEQRAGFRPRAPFSLI